MVTTAQNAAKQARAAHTLMWIARRIHSHTYINTVTTIDVVRSASSAIIEFGIIFLMLMLPARPGKGEQTGVPGENPRQPSR